MEPGDNVIDLAKERRRRGPRFDGGLMDILEVSRDLVCLCRAGNITAINGAGARMLGAATTDELVGRRIKCPACQSVVEVPASENGAEEAVTATPPSKPRAPAPAPAPNLIHFSCDCGKELQAKPALAGKRTKARAVRT